MQRLGRALGMFLAPDIGAALARFPFPALASLLLALTVTLDQYDVALVGDAEDELIPAIITAGLGALAAHLFAEGKRWTRAATVAAGGLAGAVLALLYAAPQPWRPLHPALMAGLLLVVSVAGFLRRDADLDSFWRFNERLWLSAGLAFLGAGLFAVGIFAIDRSLDVLFGIDFEELVSNVVFPFAFCLLAPLYLLSAVPSLERTKGLSPDDFLDRAVRLIARFLLVPLLCVYSAILFVYAVRIAVQWELPDGQIGWMVTAFGTVGALAVLVLHPERRAVGTLVRGFWRWWFAATLVPVLLLCLAVHFRVGQYGVTEGRYALALVAGWLAALALVFAPPRLDRDIRLIPGLLALLLLAASFGPWGMVVYGTRNQTQELVALLERRGWLTGDRLAVEAIASENANTPDLRRAASILSYLAERDGLESIAARLAEPPQLLALLPDRFHPHADIARALGVPADEPPRPPRSLAVAEPAQRIDLGGFDEALGPLSVVGGGPTARRGSAVYDGRSLTARLADGRQVAFDLVDAFAGAGAGSGDYVVPPLITARQADGRRAGLVFVDLNGSWREGDVDIYAGRVLILTAR